MVSTVIAPMTTFEPDLADLKHGILVALILLRRKLPFSLRRGSTKYNRAVTPWAVLTPTNKRRVAVQVPPTRNVNCASVDTYSPSAFQSYAAEIRSTRRLLCWPVKMCWVSRSSKLLHSRIRQQILTTLLEAGCQSTHVRRCGSRSTCLPRISRVSLRVPVFLLYGILNQRCTKHGEDSINMLRTAIDVK